MGLKYLAIGLFWVGSIAAAIVAEHNASIIDNLGAIGLALGLSVITMCLMSALLPNSEVQSDE